MIKKYLLSALFLNASFCPLIQATDSQEFIDEGQQSTAHLLSAQEKQSMERLTQEEIEWYLRPHPEDPGRLAISDFNSYNSAEVFKAGFNNLLGLSQESPPNSNVVTNARRSIKKYLENASHFPDEQPKGFKKQPARFSEQKHLVTFNLVKALRLGYQQSQYSEQDLKIILSYYKKIEGNIDSAAIDFSFRTSLQDLFKDLPSKNQEDEDFKKFRQEYAYSFKLLICKHSAVGKFLADGNSWEIINLFDTTSLPTELFLDDLEAADIPQVPNEGNSSSTKTDPFKKEQEESLRRLNDLLISIYEKRWKIVGELGLYLKLG